MTKILFSIGLFLCFSVLTVKLQAQEAATIPVIVDTDCATDDFRAIAALLVSKDFKVVGFVCTDGGLSPAEGAAGLRKLVSQLGLNIPVVEGVNLGLRPAWRQICRASWKTEGGEPSVATNYSDSLSRWFQNDQEQITYVCLGPVSSLNGWLQHVELPHNLRRVVWFYGESDASTNVSSDIKAWDELRALPVNIHLVGQPFGNYATVTQALVDKVSATEKPLAVELKQRMQVDVLKMKLSQNHLECGTKWFLFISLTHLSLR